MELLYRNPLVEQRADPWCYLHTDGYYYFTGSVPEYDRIELRRAKTLNGLAQAPGVVVWKKHESGVMSWHIWAPELHYIHGKWYIYYTAGEKEEPFKIRPYVLECTAENPLDGPWIEKGRFDVGVDSFSLDMTSFLFREEQYVAWAQTVDPEVGSNIYLAKCADPFSRATEPVLLTTPEYEWEKLGFKVNEGPAVLQRNGKVILTYSASDTGWRYCMGMLWADEKDDLLDPDSWHKSPEPVFRTSEQNGQYGPGHNCFTTDGGQDVLIYHCRSYKQIQGDPLYDPNRHARAKTFSYNAQGLPVFGEPLPEKK